LRSLMTVEAITLPQSLLELYGPSKSSLEYCTALSIGTEYQSHGSICEMVAWVCV